MLTGPFRVIINKKGGQKSTLSNFSNNTFVSGLLLAYCFVQGITNNAIHVAYDVGGGVQGQVNAIRALSC